MRFLFTAALCCITAGRIYCQRGPTPYYEDTNNIPVSPEVHPDRTVTFRLFAPKASEVVLMGSPGILEVIHTPTPLQRDDKGVWSLTVGPIPASFYTYGYAIDGGLRMPDPSIRIWKCAAGGRRVSLSCLVVRRQLLKSAACRTVQFTWSSMTPLT